MSTQANSEIGDWSARTFRGELPLSRAVASLTTDSPLVELRRAKQQGRSTVSDTFRAIMEGY